MKAGKLHPSTIPPITFLKQLDLVSEQPAQRPGLTGPTKSRYSDFEATHFEATEFEATDFEVTGFEVTVTDVKATHVE